MACFAFFLKPCPACGRSSRIAIQYLGRKVRCQHCSRVFLADDAEGQTESINDRVDYWIRFSEEFSGESNDNIPIRLPR